jgi:hypothetical protein
MSDGLPTSVSRAAFALSISMATTLVACSSDDVGDGALDTGADATVDSGDDASTGGDAGEVGEDAAESDLPESDTDAGGETSADVEDEVWTGDNAYVRIIHLSQSAPGIDVYFEDEAPEAGGAFENVRYLDTAPALGDEDVYREFPARPLSVAMVESGAPVAGAFYENTWNLSPDGYYTVYVYGIWESEDLKFTASVGVVVDDPSAPAEESTRMRFIQLAPAFNEITIFAGETQLADILGYFAFTPDYVTAQVGTYDLTVFDQGVEIFTPRITVGQETMNVFLVGETLDDTAMVTLNQGNALTMYER